jgi:hypothetical protein
MELSFPATQVGLLFKGVLTVQLEAVNTVPSRPQKITRLLQYCFTKKSVRNNFLY